MTDLEKVLKDYEHKNFHLQDPKQIKSGKEATVFVVLNDGKPLALKVYVDPSFRSFKNNIKYLEGKYFRKPSEKKAVLKGNKFGKSLIHRSWVRREFFLLEKLHELEANVPKVYAWTKDSILMEFIGNETTAPRLVDIILTEDQSCKAFDLILKDIDLLLQCGIVHGDLSSYNILWWKEKPWIIDLPQAIDIRQNPNRNSLLKRDIDNIISYFTEYFEINKEEIYKRFNLC